MVDFSKIYVNSEDGYWYYYGLTYISPSINNSVINNVNIKDTLIDDSHPSDIAHQQLARSLWSQFGYM